MRAYWPGPKGRSKKYQTASTAAQASQKQTVKGRNREISVPNPAFGS